MVELNESFRNLAKWRGLDGWIGKYGSFYVLATILIMFKNEKHSLSVGWLFGAVSGAVSGQDKLLTGARRGFMGRRLGKIGREWYKMIEQIESSLNLVS